MRPLLRPVLCQRLPLPQCLRLAFPRNYQRFLGAPNRSTWEHPLYGLRLMEGCRVRLSPMRHESSLYPDVGDLFYVLPGAHWNVEYSGGDQVGVPDWRVELPPLRVPQPASEFSFFSSFGRADSRIASITAPRNTCGNFLILPSSI